MRDLQHEFGLRVMASRDIRRLMWWTRGIREGAANIFRDSLAMPPEDDMAAEYTDGWNLGREMTRQPS